jgi:hypothetical protein
MRNKRNNTDEIIPRLAESDVLLGQGRTIGQATRLKELEAENARLKRVVTNLTFDKLVLEEVVQERG